MCSSMKMGLTACVLWAAACYGDTIILVGTPLLLGANDSILWNQLGSDGTTITHSFSLITSGSLPASGSYTGTTGLVAVACPALPQCSWGPVIGISGGDTLNWAFNPAGNGGNGIGTGPITLNIPNGFGAGAIISADQPAGVAFTAKLELFNGASSLGFVTAASNSNGDAFFIGARDTTGANVNKAVFSLTAIAGGGDLGDFAIDTVSLNDQVPEPASAFLLGSALLALGWKRRAMRTARERQRGADR